MLHEFLQLNIPPHTHTHYWQQKSDIWPPDRGQFTASLFFTFSRHVNQIQMLEVKFRRGETRSQCVYAWVYKEKVLQKHSKQLRKGDDGRAILVKNEGNLVGCFFIPTGIHTGTESSALPTCPLKIKRTIPRVSRWARGPNNTYKKLKWTSVHLSPMVVTCCTPTFLYQIIWKCMEKGNSAEEGESWDCERTATPANWAVRGPVGNEQCQEEIKEWEKGERKKGWSQQK